MGGIFCRGTISIPPISRLNTRWAIFPLPPIFPCIRRSTTVGGSEDLWVWSVGISPADEDTGSASPDSEGDPEQFVPPQKDVKEAGNDKMAALPLRIINPFVTSAEAVADTSPGRAKIIYPVAVTAGSEFRAVCRRLGEIDLDTRRKNAKLLALLGLGLIS